ncbi:hypothetical protein CDIK_4205 [Cucumispora dikerogammari]|nr:hypothetical protein CDIK_4205 [Cucumispora dikerogammari]
MCSSGGFIYNFYSLINSNTRWRCELRTCRGYIITNKSDEIIKEKQHSHDSNELKVKKNILMAKLKDRIINTKENSRNIITDMLSKTEENLLIAIPPISYLVDKSTRIRNNGFERFQPDYEDFPDSLKKTMRKETFLQFDSGIECPNRVVLFYSLPTIEYLKKSDVIMMDGTFKICPPSFYQIYTIHGVIYGKSFPMIYIIMKNKTQSAYSLAFNFINRNININPKYILLDFEIAAINAARETFPHSKVQGCLFHFGQSLWKKLQNLSLSQKYKNDKNFNQTVRMLLNLAFVPPVDVIKQYSSIIKIYKKTENKELQKFLKYFENTYVGSVEQDNIYKEPIFSPDLWSCFFRVLDRAPRTTNAVESWHRSIRRKIESTHPNMSKLIDSFQKEEETVHLNLIKAARGELQLIRKNFKKEFLLINTLTNYSNYKEDGFFLLLNKIYGWKFSEK